MASPNNAQKLVDCLFEKRRKVSKAARQSIRLGRRSVCPIWNYIIRLQPLPSVPDPQVISGQLLSTVRARSVTIVIPMAGEGLRFKNKGITIPKPLIPVRGMPMFLWAIKNLPQNYENYVFICLKEHIDKFGIDRQIKTYLSNRVKIVVSDQPTEGQACTVLLADSLIGDKPLIIHNADTFFECEMSFVGDERIDGAIPYFESDDPTMSFIKFGYGSDIVEVAEKKPISTHATIGLYYFSRGSDFLWAAKEMINKDNRVNNEFYVGPVYNYLIDRGDKIIGVSTEAVWDLGTPKKAGYFEKFYQSRSKSPV